MCCACMGGACADENCAETAEEADGGVDGGTTGGTDTRTDGGTDGGTSGGAAECTGTAALQLPRLPMAGWAEEAPVERSAP